MWKQKNQGDDTVHIRVMGALAVGKTTMVSTAVTRNAQRRSMPYSRSKQLQRFVCSVRSPAGDMIVAELLDTRGNEPLEGISSATESAAHAEERMRLLDKADVNIRWCYLIVFDFTRHDTYIYARRLIERIRAQEFAQMKAKRSPQSPIFLVGNKREMCATATVATWITELRRFGDDRDTFCYVFAGSAIDNSFESLDLSQTKCSMLRDALKVGGQEDISSLRLSIEQLICIFHSLLTASRQSKQPIVDAAQSSLKEEATEGEDGDISDNECQRCWQRLFSWGLSPSETADKSG